MENRKFRYGEEVFIFANFERGLPHIYKGVVSGLTKSFHGGFTYYVEACGMVYVRGSDAIYSSVAEMAKDLPLLVVE